MLANGRERVAAVILAHNRARAVEQVVGRVLPLPFDEIVVVDSGSTDSTPDVVRRLAERDGSGRLRLIEPGANVALAGRNMGVEATDAEFIVMLDDDSYPLPGAIETLLAGFEFNSQLGVLGGFVRDVDERGRLIRATELGTFDWWLGANADDTVVPSDGWPTFFFPEGACMVRRTAYEDVGGFFEPYFFACSEVDLATRMLAAGWDVRYQPRAWFDHMKAPAGRMGNPMVFRYRVRNQLWYFWMYFPPALAARRMVAYLIFDLIECAYRGVLRAWAAGIVEAWQQRDRVAPYRRPLPRSVLRRAELNRGRLHIRLLIGQLLRRL